MTGEDLFMANHEKHTAGQKAGRGQGGCLQELEMSKTAPERWRLIFLLFGKGVREENGAGEEAGVGEGATVPAWRRHITWREEIRGCGGRGQTAPLQPQWVSVVLP